MLELGFKQIVAIAGFIIVLIAIPLSFTLLKNSQILNSKAYQEKPKRQQITQTASTSAKPKEIPATSPLSDLKKMLADATNSATSTLNPNVESGSGPTPNLAFGPILSLKISLEGRPAGSQAAKVFIGISTGTAQTKPSYTLSFTVDVPASGAFSGLSLAGLNPGSTYTAFIKGSAQIDAASTFVMSPTESVLNTGQPLTLISGDLNEDNTINSADYTIGKNLYGTTSKSSNWNSRADLNSDGTINSWDLSIITKNMGKTGASGVWYSPIPVATSSAVSTSSGSPAGGYWLWVP